MENEPRGGFFRLVWMIAGLVLIAVGIMLIVEHMRGSHNSEVKFLTPYQAVLLTNGSVYFGKLQGYGSSAPELTQVYYVVSQTNPETKQVTNSLIRRGQELHKPDRMYLNPRQILFVEPVGTDSRVAQLIKEQGGQ
ncbi:MAG TPA: hypothetical protein VG206_16485 [Terriglobia bacterium]|nr:hypothetical protein [Terriglobia bacterium]